MLMMALVVASSRWTGSLRYCSLPIHEHCDASPVVAEGSTSSLSLHPPRPFVPPLTHAAPVLPFVEPLLSEKLHVRQLFAVLVRRPSFVLRPSALRRPCVVHSPYVSRLLFAVVPLSDAHPLFALLQPIALLFVLLPPFVVL